MKNKEIIAYINKELEYFTSIYGEIKDNRDYHNFIKSLYNLSISIKHLELGNPLGISISEVLKDKEEISLILKNLKTNYD